MKIRLSKSEARDLIEAIERRAGCGLPYRAEFDAFKDDFTVRELVASTLLALGFDREWVAGEFDELLEAAVQAHLQNVRKGA